MIFIKSKFTWYLFVRYLLILAFCIWTFIFGISISDQESGTALIVVAVLCTIYGLYFALTQIVGVTISTEGINLKSLRDYFIKWDEVSDIEVTGRKYVLMRHESVTIKKRDKNTYKIIVEHFANADKIRFYLLHFRDLKNAGENYIPKLLLQNQPKKVEENFKEQVLKKYGRSSFLSFLGIFFWITEIFFSIVLILSVLNGDNSLRSLAFLLLAMAVIYWTIGKMMYYFQLSEKIFIIRNHLFPWVTKSVYLDDIYEIAFESGSDYRYNITRLRVITKNFQSKAFPGASVFNKEFKQMEEDLIKYNIQVRVE